MDKLKKVFFSITFSDNYNTFSRHMLEYKKNVILFSISQTSKNNTHTHTIKERLHDPIGSQFN